VDFIAVAINIRGHFGIPEARLMSKMHTRFQHLSHGYRHKFSFGIEPPFISAISAHLLNKYACLLMMNV
jgi:hypothetical protein